MPFADIYRGKRVLLTGHTGFKGSWLSEWLLLLGAEITGLALPPAAPSLFQPLELATRMNHRAGDIRDLDCVRRAVEAAQPDFVFHLAAQALVRHSYQQPVETYATNVLGTVHLLEAIRLAHRPCIIVAITSDKCYENREWVHSYREQDHLGGHDPYSSSKAAAELVISAYRRSYFGSSAGVCLASARAGNVVGGGDWAPDRIIPDCIRALQEGRSILVRNKVATRPWQHVLESLSGYLQLGAEIHLAANNSPPSAVALQRTDQPSTLRSRAAKDGSTLDSLCSAFNFGPSHESNRTVAEIVAEVLKHWPGNWEDRSDPNAAHEAKLLNLATDKAYHWLRWQPVWNFEQTIAGTVDWYRRCAGDASLARPLTSIQINDYVKAARSAGLPWAL